MSLQHIPSGDINAFTGINELKSKIPLLSFNILFFFFDKNPSIPVKKESMISIILK